MAARFDRQAIENGKAVCDSRFSRNGIAQRGRKTFRRSLHLAAEIAFELGIELPFDRDYVNYVWFDALSNYISFAGYDPSRSTISDQSSTFRDKWPALHVI